MLERVVIAPTGTRVALRGIGPNAFVELQVRRKRIVLQTNGAIPGLSGPDDLWEYRASESFVDQRGDWILTVKEEQFTELKDATSNGDLWVFRFTIP